MGQLVDIRPEIFVSSKTPEKARPTIRIFQLLLEENPLVYLEAFDSLTPRAYIPDPPQQSVLATDELSASPPRNHLAMFLARKLDTYLFYDEETERSIENNHVYAHILGGMALSNSTEKTQQLRSYARYHRFRHVLERLVIYSTLDKDVKS